MDITDAPIGAVASGGGYSDWEKIGRNSWKNSKTGALSHDEGLFSRIGTFNDFKIKIKDESKGRKEKDSLIEKYKENGLTLNIEKWDNLPEDISKFLKEKDVNRINNKLYKLSTRWESASDRGVDVSESYYDQVNDLQSIIENSLKEAGFSIEVGEGDDTTLEFNFK